MRGTAIVWTASECLITYVSSLRVFDKSSLSRPLSAPAGGAIRGVLSMSHILYLGVGHSRIRRLLNTESTWVFVGIVSVQRDVGKIFEVAKSRRF